MESCRLQTSLTATPSSRSWRLLKYAKHIPQLKSCNLQETQLLTSYCSTIRTKSKQQIKSKRNHHRSKLNRKCIKNISFKHKSCSSNSETSGNWRSSNHNGFKLLRIHKTNSPHVLHKRFQVIIRYRINWPPFFLPIVGQLIMFSTGRQARDIQKMFPRWWAKTVVRCEDWHCNLTRCNYYIVSSSTFMKSYLVQIGRVWCRGKMVWSSWSKRLSAALEHKAYKILVKRIDDFQDKSFFTKSNKP